MSVIERRIVGKGLAHDSALKHVTGTAAYIDDMPELPGTLHAALILSPVAHGRLKSVDTSAALAMPGVVRIVLANDIPGHNEVGPILHGELLFAKDIVDYRGCIIGAVAAQTMAQAVKAAHAVKLDIEPLAAVLDVEAAHSAKSYVQPSQTVVEGDMAAGFAASDRIFTGRQVIGGQDHFYLETHIAYAIPGEDDDMLVHSSTQHPTEVQHHVAGVLGIPASKVECQIRRMGGGFGGKESQPTIIAAAAALLARFTRRPVKLRLRRRDDMTATGKRHHMVANWKAGIDKRGRITVLDVEYLAGAGNTPDLTGPVIARALCHTDNSYFIPNAHFVGHACKTNTVSNTAFRGFGGPQGIIAIEAIMDTIAREAAIDPNELRRINFYGPDTGEVTPYGQPVEDNRLPEVTEAVLANAEWDRRRAEIDAHNANNPIIRRGIALVPIKYGISFSKKAMNQGAVLLNIYRDGSVHLNQGGTEMGQGLHTKIAQVVADELSIPLKRIRITATATDKVPNATPTAGSLGADLNGMAALDACRQIKERIVAYAVEAFRLHPEQVSFAPDAVRCGGEVLSWPDIIHRLYNARVSLSAAGFYKTPHIDWDRKAGRGNPYLYFTYGASVSEVEVDSLTGEYVVARTDILQDVGNSLNRDIDIGQIEGGFLQGMGWLTTEELWWDAAGRLRTHAPSTYKIPGSRDVPPVFNVSLLDQLPNKEETVFRSKAIGEPPLMLAISVWLAIRDAIASIAGNKFAPDLEAPATPEHVLESIGKLRARAGI
jgi:xanthine dehydrogenase large subunit